jgi:hypothetical protein
MLDGRPFTATCPPVRRHATGSGPSAPAPSPASLPRRTTVSDDAAHWIAGYDTAPINTRVVHTVNIAHIVAALAPPVSARSPRSDTTRLINILVARRSAVLADRVCRTTSARFASAPADGLCPSARRSAASPSTSL